MKTVSRNNYAPKVCDFTDTVVYDAAAGLNYLFDCDGIYTRFSANNTFVDVADTVSIAPGEPARVEAKRKDDNLYLTFYIPQGGDAALEEQLAELQRQTDANAGAIAEEQADRILADNEIRAYVDSKSGGEVYFDADNLSSGNGFNSYVFGTALSPRIYMSLEKDAVYEVEGICRNFSVTDVTRERTLHSWLSLQIGDGSDKQYAYTESPSSMDRSKPTYHDVKCIFAANSARDIYIQFRFLKPPHEELPESGATYYWGFRDAAITVRKIGMKKKK